MELFSNIDDLIFEINELTYVNKKEQIDYFIKTIKDPKLKDGWIKIMFQLTAEKTIIHSKMILNSIERKISEEKNVENNSLHLNFMLQLKNYFAQNKLFEKFNLLIKKCRHNRPSQTVYSINDFLKRYKNNNNKKKSILKIFLNKNCCIDIILLFLLCDKNLFKIRSNLHEFVLKLEDDNFSKNKVIHGQYFILPKRKIKNISELCLNMKKKNHNSKTFNWESNCFILFNRHDDDTDEYKIYQIHYKQEEIFIFQDNDKYVFVSEEIKHELHEWLGTNNVIFDVKSKNNLKSFII